MEALEESAMELDCALLLPIFHDFLSKQIEDCDPEAELKEYLTYAAAVDLESFEWFQAFFPDFLQVRHTLTVYMYLRELESPR